MELAIAKKICLAVFRERGFPRTEFLALTRVHSV